MAFFFFFVVVFLRERGEDKTQIGRILGATLNWVTRWAGQKGRSLEEHHAKLTASSSRDINCRGAQIDRLQSRS